MSYQDALDILTPLDEHLSHSMWRIGVLGFAVLLIYREWRRPAGIETTGWVAILGGIIYGFTYFCIFQEGQTVVILHSSFKQ